MTEPQDLTAPIGSLPHFTVIQLTKNWISGDTQVSQKKDMAQQFEDAIEAYRRRSYFLHSFEYNCTSTGNGAYRESIVAVFEKKGSKPGI